MVILIVDENPVALGTQAKWMKQETLLTVHTATSLRTAGFMLGTIPELDLIILPSVTRGGDPVYFRDQVKQRFPNLLAVFATAPGNEIEPARLGSDLMFPAPIDKQRFLPWLEHWYVTRRSNSYPGAPPARKRTEPREITATVLVSPGTDPTGLTTPLPVSQTLEPGEPSPGATLTGSLRAEHVEPIRPGKPRAKATNYGASESPLPELNRPVAQDDEFEKPGLKLPARIGDFELRRRLWSSRMSETYEAFQFSVERTVALELLDGVHASNENIVSRFLDNVRAKAAAVHPTIVPVYEAKQDEGAVFYTREHVEGKSMRDYNREGFALPGEMLLSILKTCASSFGFLESRNLAHEKLKPVHIWIAHDAQIRVANLALSEGATLIDRQEGMQDVATVVKPMISGSGKPANALVAEICEKLSGQAYSTWDDVVAAADAANDNLLSHTTGDMTNAAAYSIEAMSAAKKRRDRQLLIILGCIGGVAVLGLGVWYFFFARPPDAKDFDEWITISAGEFIYQDGNRINLPAFDIDKYEVTVAQYAEFVAAMDKSPSSVFDHADQPASAAGHRPPDWDAYYEAAAGGKDYRGARLDLNCPVTMVTFWDAYAYAKWRQRRLPTAEEWEKAARGNTGFKYPWGNEPDALKSNSEESAGTIEGYEDYGRWCPVDAIPGDASPAGVIGMLGNVSEWTETLHDHPEIPDKRVRVLCGGSFSTDAVGLVLTERWFPESDEDRKMNFGFRTVGKP